jgi:MFS family permease
MDQAAETDAPLQRGAPPYIWAALYAPFGMSNGYVTVTLAWLLSHAGASVEAVAALAGWGLLPNTWKVLWSPLVDTTLTARIWFLIGAVTTAATLLAVAFLPLEVRLLPVFAPLVALNAFAATLCAIAADRMMAYDTAESEKGRAGGWSQAGNLGGSGLGGGAGLWIAQHSGQPWLAGLALGVACLACCWPLRRLADPAPSAEARSYGAVLVETGRDLFSLVRSRIGLLACFIVLLPLGTGGAQQVWAAIAGEWRAGADDVALVAGALSGVAGLVGALTWGFVCDRMDRKGAYLLAGVLSAAAAAVMALGPRTPLAFLALASLYNLVVGFAYCAYAAVVLEAIGHGAAGTKFNLLASLANVPILGVTLADGWTQTHRGSAGMLYAEAAIGIAAAGLYLLVAWVTRGWSWGGLGRVLGLTPPVIPVSRGENRDP